MSSLGWMIAAFVCTGIGIGGYVAILVARERKLTRHLEELGREA